MENIFEKMDKETKSWLEEKLIPNLKLTLNVQNSVTKYKILPSKTPFLMSSFIFLEIETTGEKESKVFSLVVKRPPRDAFMRQFINSNKIFHNEILFYTKYAKNSEDYPRCFYTLEDPPENSVLVLENISKQGYQDCPQMVDLDMKYILASMKEIGKFHAKGYVLKNKSPEEFFKIVSDVQETRYECEEGNQFAFMLNNLVRRVIRRLRSRNYDPDFCSKAEIFFSNAFKNIMQAATKPEIPLATICHGDFTKNNVFFKESDSDMRAKLFDFALITYGSPAIDISTFIYLSVSREDIRTKFEEIFDAYHDSVLCHLRKSGFSNVDEFSKENFLKEYKRHALFGYIIASFFLPVMSGKEIPDMDQVARSTPEEILSRLDEIGEDELEIFTGMLLDLREMGCLDHVLA